MWTKTNSLYRLSIRTISISALTAFLGLAGCCGSFDAETAKRNDSAREWLRYWQSNYDWEETSHWKSVQQSKMRQADVLLHDVTFVRLTEAQALELAGEFIQHSNSRGAIYLLRGVNAAPARFPQQVFVRVSGDVWVGGGANSRCPVPMERRAVVVWLDRPPHEVYVTFVVGK